MRAFWIAIFLLFSTSAFAIETVDIESLKISNITTVVTVTTTATPLPATALAGRKAVMIQNLDSTAIIYLGNTDVTATENSNGGFQLANQYDVVTLDFTDSNVICGIVSSGSAKVAVWESR